MNRLIGLLLVVLSSVSYAKDIDSAAGFLADFLSGHYTLVGKAVNSDATYTGKVTLYQEHGALKVKRAINNRVVLADATLEKSFSGDADVLKIQFTDNGVNYKESCLFSGDLDNYARISCYLYMADGETNSRGLETFFIDPVPR
ncbi:MULTISPECIES: hypothetical protein [unclassified Oceanobacter]|jgi:hypothetical protein|uniref:hypothetical protein n=1 Tax=unclassified Oceanobacter TaxID=2620260 RepID=UPI0026E17C81|nr:MULTISPECIES: hypothetical protein [unclassified Oceanobacter]MDO6682639.1 hypothetical protein [Oceanobacter sp. 5_MG-2023]MDP2608874.1 hypothetical protein [Oceanobacter sp. 1_MG-2023]MDP2611884.1 hypothetical protein [Oceanobacter sp. 2_MG-2023]